MEDVGEDLFSCCYSLAAAPIAWLTPFSLRLQRQQWIASLQHANSLTSSSAPFFTVKDACDDIGPAPITHDYLPDLKSVA